MPKERKNEKKRICILTPGSIDSNPRLVKEASALHQNDYEVTTIVNRLSNLLDFSEKPKVAWRIEFVDLRSKKLWWVLRAKQIGTRVLERITGFYKFADLGFSALTRRLADTAIGIPADLYIAHYPAALPAAAWAAQHHNSCYAYDVEDFHLGDWPDDPQYDTERRLVQSIEGRYLPGCAFVTAASPMIADALVETYGIQRPEVILNVFPLRQAPASFTQKGIAKPGPSLYWFSQTIGANRGLECAVRAIGLSAHRPHLYLRGNLAAGYLDQLETLALETGAKGRVHILPPSEPEKLERLAAEYDLGLASETRVSRNRQICLTNKLFSFLLAGLPPLMSDTPAQQRFADEAGLSDLVYPMDNAHALANLMDSLLSDPTRLARTREQVWLLGQTRYNWECEQQVFVREFSREFPA